MALELLRDEAQVGGVNVRVYAALVQLVVDVLVNRRLSLPVRYLEFLVDELLSCSSKERESEGASR